MTEPHIQQDLYTKAGPHLHVVAFDVPYPPNYGGVIDIYYRLLNLADSGVHIHLHCFAYGRERAPELEAVCCSVQYYRRDVSLKNLFRKIPYIVCSRNNRELKDDLLTDDYPILLEGLHCCSILEDKRFEKRNIMVRTHNVEHEYYGQLSLQERRLWKKKYLKDEAEKLKRYEPVLAKATSIVAINRGDREYFQQKYARATWIPSHHKYNHVIASAGRGKYLLYHGNLSVPENAAAAEWLVEHVLSKTGMPVKIAGMNPPGPLVKTVSQHGNMELLANPSEEEMEVLLRDAHIVLLYTEQSTGLKLKLLNSLYSARFCLVNRKMVEGTGLESLCEIADSAEEMLDEIRILSNVDFSKSEKERRERLLAEDYSNGTSTARWKKLIEK